MKILILSPFVYGSKIGHAGGFSCFRQLARLAQSHEIHFLSFVESANDQITEDCLAELRDFCKSVTTVRANRTFIKRLWAVFKQLTGKVPHGVVLTQSRLMQRKLSHALSYIKPDVVLIQFPQMAQYVVYCKKFSTVLDVHDAKSVSAYRSYKFMKSSKLEKLRLFIDWLSWVRYESYFYPLFRELFTMTEQDRIGLRIFSPNLRPKVIPTAAINIPAKVPKQKEAEANRIGFVGPSFHPPNIDAVQFFADDIFPLLLKKFPNTQFCVAGRGFSDLVVRNHQNTSLLGYVEDIEEFYHSCKIIVIPLRFGGGIKSKTVEAMAFGCPVVSTAIGIEEIGAVNGIHAFIADTPFDFAEKLVRLMEDRPMREKLSMNARDLVVKRFSFEKRSEKLEKIIQNIA